MSSTTLDRPGAATRRPAGPRRTDSRRGPSAWFAAPALAIFGLFAIVPLIGVLVLSFMSWDGLGTPTWAGVDNWQRTFADPGRFLVVVANLERKGSRWRIGHGTRHRGRQGGGTSS